MTNFKEGVSPCELLDCIMGLIDGSRISIEIDEPIDRTAQTFQVTVKEPVSHTDFNRVIAEFIRHIYPKGLRLKRILSQKTALIEAIYLLNKHYQGIYDSGYGGYEGAFLDIARGELEGLKLVLSQIVESIKNVEREKYIQGVIICNVDQLDWKMKLLLVQAYLNKYKDLLPPHLVNIEPY